MKIIITLMLTLLGGSIGFQSGSHNAKLKAEHQVRILEQQIDKLEIEHAQKQALLHQHISTLEASLALQANDDPNADRIAIDADGVRRINSLNTNNTAE